MAWQVVTSVWLLLVIGCALAALCFLRVLALECKRGVEAHETQLHAAQLRVDYELNRREKQKENEAKNAREKAPA